jgi:hypothetical protein
MASVKKCIKNIELQRKNIAAVSFTTLKDDYIAFVTCPKTGPILLN